MKLRDKLFVVMLSPLVLAGVNPGQGAHVDFNRDVRPILADLCFECHGPAADGRKGKLRLDTREGALASAIVPGKPEVSPLMERLLAADESDRMPPPESPRQPKEGQIEILRQWIADGAPYEQHWAYRPVRRPDAPKVKNHVWVRNPVDALVLALLETRGLKPRADAAPGVLARRLSLALTGLPVLPKRLRAFEADYRHNPEAAVIDLVDELLASPAYGEHMAWAWMDAARYADTNGYQGDGPRVMWPWRDWLIRALNDNLSFDELTRRMLAGDLLLPQAHADWKTAGWIPDQRASDLLVATGFLRNHRYDSGSGTIPAESKFENAADRLETVGAVWMGTTLLCARCHSHKFDPFEQREYYQLLSFFDNVPEVGNALKQASHPYIHSPTEEQATELRQLKKKADQAAAAFEEAQASIAASLAEWESQLRAEDTKTRFVSLVACAIALRPRPSLSTARLRSRRATSRSSSLSAITSGRSPSGSVRTTDARARSSPVSTNPNATAPESRRTGSRAACGFATSAAG